MKKVKRTITAALAVSLAVGTMIPAAAQETEPKKFSLDLETSEVASMLLESALEMDSLAWIGKYHLDLNVDQKEDIGALKLHLGLNEETIANVLAYIDTANMEGYFQIPELSEEYLKVDLAEVMDMAEEGAGEDISIQLGNVAQAGEAMTPENQEQAMEILTTYGTPFLACIEEVSESTGKVSYQGKTAEITYSGMSLNIVSAVDTLKEQLTILKDDQETLDFLSQFATEGEFSAEMIEELCEELEGIDTADLGGIELQVNYGSGEDGAIAGNITMAAEGEKLKLAELVAFTGEEATEGYVWVGTEESKFRLNFDIQDQDATFGLYMDDAGVAQLKAEIADKSGIITITPIAESEEDIGAALDGAALIVKYADEGERAFANLEIVYADMSLAKLEGSAEDGEQIEIPDLTAVSAYDMLDEEALEAYAGTVDPTQIFENLSAAGMPEEEETTEE
ncbi:MAG: hypothetical protein ACI4EI_05225 [Muricoprocola sp.]